MQVLSEAFQFVLQTCRTNADGCPADKRIVHQRLADGAGHIALIQHALLRDGGSVLSELTDMCAADNAPQKIVDIVPGQRIVGGDLLREAVIPGLAMFPLPELADIDKAKRLLRVL